MSTARFDELIHAPTRLAIVSLLAAAQWADFKYIRDELGLSDSALSKQLATLESAGYVEIRKGFVGQRPRTSAKPAARNSSSTRRPSSESLPGHSRMPAPGRPLRPTAETYGAKPPDLRRPPGPYSEPVLVRRSATGKRQTHRSATRARSRPPRVSHVRFQVAAVSPGRAASARLAAADPSRYDAGDLRHPGAQSRTSPRRVSALSQPCGPGRHVRHALMACPSPCSGPPGAA
jgi:hypothetical protein